jgi:hypothetical protein
VRPLAFDLAWSLCLIRALLLNEVTRFLAPALNDREIEKHNMNIQMNRRDFLQL